MAAGSIVYELLMKTASFFTDTERAKKSLKQLQKEAEATQRAFKASFTGNLLADFVGQAATRLARMPGEVLASVDAFNDLKDATGASIENISAIDRVARETGVGFETVSTSLIKLNKALGEAKPDSDTAKALNLIGLSAEQLKKDDPAEALRKVAVALNGFADDGNKARITQELFGKSLAEVAPLLRDLGEKTELVGKTTTEQAQAVEEFRKLIFRLGADSQDGARALVNDLLPAINEIIKAFVRGKETGETFFNAIFGNTSQGRLTANAQAIAGQIERTTDSIIRMQEELDRKGGNDSFLSTRIEKARERLKALQTQAQAASGALKNLADAREPIVDPTNFSNEGRGPKRSTGQITATAKKVKDDFSPLLKSAREAEALARATGAAENDLTEAQKQRIKVQAELDNGTLKLTKTQKDQLFGIYATTDALQRENALRDRQSKASQEAASAAEAFYQTQQGTLRGYVDEARAIEDQIKVFGLNRYEVEQLESAKLRAAAASLQLLAAQKEEREGNESLGKLYRDQADALLRAADARDVLTKKEKDLHYDGLVGATQAVKDYIDSLNRAGDDSYRFLTGTFQALEDGITEALSSGNYKDAAKKMVDGIIQEFIRLSLVKPLLNSIFGGQSSGTGSWAGIAGALAGIFGGGMSIDTSGYSYQGSTLPSTLRGGGATGTNLLERDMITLVHKGEAIVPKAYNPAAGGKGQGGNVYITNNGGSRVTAERDDNGDFRVLVEAAAEAAHNRVNASIASGGSTHRLMAGQYGLSRAAGAPKRA